MSDRKEYFTDLLRLTGLGQPKHIVSLIKEDDDGWWRKNTMWWDNWFCAIPFFCRIWFKFEGFLCFKMVYKETKGRVYVRPDILKNW
jgi:hypothetical protein